MARLTPLLVGICVVAVGGSDCWAQSPEGTAAAQGLRVVSRSELRAVPGVSETSEAVLEALAARRQSSPPDGILRSTIYVKGSAVRIERSGPGRRLVTISPSGSNLIYSIDEDAKTFAKYALSSARGPSAMDIDARPTGATETIASLPAVEVRFTARGMSVRAILEPPRPQAHRYDGYASSESAAAAMPRTASTQIVPSGAFTEGRMWLVDLPAGGDARKLATMVSGGLDRVMGGRFPARLIRSYSTPAHRADVETCETVESIESLPLDDALFQVPAGLREVPLRTLHGMPPFDPSAGRRR